MKFMFKLKNFTSIRDTEPKKPLNEILPVSRRTMVLLIRNQQKQIIETNCIRIFGAVDMIGGLEYHHSNFKAIVAERSKFSVRSCDTDEERWVLERNFRHEAIAYLNRVGQLFHFVDSKWVKQLVPNSSELIPTLSKYKIFRDKHAAHRSIDKPLNDDAHAQTIQAWGLSSVSGIAYSPKGGVSTIKSVEDLLDEKKLWCDHYVTFQIRGKNENEFINFCIEMEHPKILAEAFNLVEMLVLKSP